MNKRKIAHEISKNLSRDRMKHSVGVMLTARKLAEIYNVCPTKAELTGLLHDCGKYFTNQEMMQKAKEFNICASSIQRLKPSLLHGPVGAEIAKLKYPDLSEDMYNAIYYHTTGRLFMSDLEKIIYVSDLIEPFRNYPEVGELRKLVGIDLDLLTAKVMDEIICFLIRKKRYIDPVTVAARNNLYYQIRTLDNSDKEG